MFTFLNNIFTRKVEGDFSALQDSSELSFLRSQIDRKLYSFFLENDQITEDYKCFVKTSLELVSSQKILLQNEIENLEEYIKHFSKMYGSSTFYKIDIKYSSKDELKIHPFLLFPLIINSFYNGYDIMGKFPVRIRIGVSGSIIKMEVSNRINHYLVNQELTEDIRCLKSRLKLIFKDNYTLIFNSNSNIFKSTLILDLT